MAYYKALMVHQNRYHAHLSLISMVLGLASVFVYGCSSQWLLADREFKAFEIRGGANVSNDSLDSLHWMPVIMSNRCIAGIEFTDLPKYGSFDDLKGQVDCIPPADYQIAVYIFVTGWWTKPTFTRPLTAIENDSTWMTDITTGGNDHLATQVAAFLIPNGYDPPPMAGGLTLPPDLFENSVAQEIVEREPVFSTIEFSGYTWNVKVSKAPTGPGPNYFSDKEEDVWVDVDGRLHLNIVFKDDRWYATEVFTAEPLGFGTYTFTVASPVDQLDKNVVLGLFTWDANAPNNHYREIDMEFSRWGEDGAKNAQFVVQPWSVIGNRHRFDMKLDGVFSTHSFKWHSDSIQFASFQGQDMLPDPNDGIDSWLYTGTDIPTEGDGNARINLWLLSGMPPSDKQELEVIIETFKFSASE